MFTIRLVRRSILAQMAALALLAIVPNIAQARLVAKLYAPGHHPKANKKWPIRITARNGHKEVCGKVRYAFLFEGRKVSDQLPGVGRDFCGTFRDPNFIWPTRAVGIPLTLRCVVDTKIGQANLDYAVRVVR
jgi:hypothetical protein